MGARKGPPANLAPHRGVIHCRGPELAHALCCGGADDAAPASPAAPEQFDDQQESAGLLAALLRPPPHRLRHQAPRRVAPRSGALAAGDSG